MNDFSNIPAARAGRIRKVLSRNFTWSGRIFGRFAGASDLERGAIDTWVEYF
jgi:hypothetical protein